MRRKTRTTKRRNASFGYLRTQKEKKAGRR